MNKTQMADTGRIASCTSRHFRISPSSSFFDKVGKEVVIDPVAPNVPAIDFCRMAEDASRIQAYIAKGGKKADPSDTIIKPSGLFSNK